MNTLKLYGGIGLLVLILAGAVTLYVKGGSEARAEAKAAAAKADAKLAGAEEQIKTLKAQIDAGLATLADERSKRQELDGIVAQLEQERIDAEQMGKRVAGDVAAGTLRLRQEWAGCETRILSAATATAAQRDADAQRRAEAAGRVVRIGADADAQLAACQAVVKADRAN